VYEEGGIGFLEGVGTAHQRAAGWAFTLGLVGVLLIGQPVTGILAIVLGKRAASQANQAGLAVPWEARPAVVLGIVGLVLGAVALSLILAVRMWADFLS
jgi:deoxyinosine 3'endonuclease (endonuclease V)